MKYLLAIFCFCMLAIMCNSCKKNTYPQSGSLDTNRVVADSVDTLIGTYVGNIMRTTEIKYSTTSITTYDTTYSTDTIYIVKVSVDSFRITNTDWYPWNHNGTFRYKTGNVYNTGWGRSGTSEGLVLSFYPVNDSLQIEKSFYNGGYSGYSKTSTYFMGKK